MDKSTHLLNTALGQDSLAMELMMLEVSEERTQAESGLWGMAGPAHLSTLTYLVVHMDGKAELTMDCYFRHVTYSPWESGELVYL